MKTDINKRYSLYIDIIVITAASVVMMFFSMQMLRYTPVGIDAAALSIAPMKILGKGGIKFFSEYLLFGSLPVNVFDSAYAFCIQSYMLLVFMAIFGAGSLALKMFGLIISLSMLIMLYKALIYAFNRPVAASAILLLASSPVLKIFSLYTVQVMEYFMNFFIVGALFMFVLYLKNKKNFYLLFSSFFAGLGLSMKISVIAIYSGLVIAVFVFYREYIYAGLRRLSLISFTLLLAGFMAGASLFIYYNAASGGKTFHLIKVITGHSDAGVDNTNLSGNISERLKQAGAMLGFLKKRKLSSNILLSIIFLLSLVFNSIYCSLNKKGSCHFILVIYVVYATAFLMSCFSPASLSGSHYGLFVLFPEISVSVFIFLLGEILFKSRKGKKTFWISVISALVIYNIILNIKDNTALRLADSAKPYREIAAYLNSNSENIYFYSWRQLDYILRLYIRKEPSGFVQLSQDSDDYTSYINKAVPEGTKKIYIIDFDPAFLSGQYKDEKLSSYIRENSENILDQIIFKTGAGIPVFRIYCLAV